MLPRHSEQGLFGGALSVRREDYTVGRTLDKYKEIVLWESNTLLPKTLVWPRGDFDVRYSNTSDVVGGHEYWHSKIGVNAKMQNKRNEANSDVPGHP